VNAQIALLIGANPKTAKRGPTVVIGEGNWRIDVEGTVDSLLLLHHPSGEMLINGRLVVIQGPAEIFVEVYKAGSEQFINVSASRI